MKRVTVEAPASSANLGPGFDVFALAFDQPRDRILVSVEKASKLRVEMNQKGGTAVPLDANENGAGETALAIARHFGLKARIGITIWKSVPIGVGIGSSAASAAASAVAMNEVFGLSMVGGELTYYAGEGEAATSGAAHYDNVAASIMGGFVVVRGGKRPSPIRFPPPNGLELSIATPKVSLPAHKTEYARSILPKSVKLSQMVENVAHASTVVSGFALGDIGLIGEGMEDAVVEQARKRMIPGYDAVRRESLQAGASGVCISGAGPSMLAISDQKGKPVLRAMLQAFRKSGVVAEGFTTTVGHGARIIESK